MRIISLAMPAALLLLTLIACNQGAKNETEKQISLNRRIITEDKAPAGLADDVATADSTVSLTGSNEELPPVNDPAADQVGHSVNTSNNPSANPDWDKKIVKTADISLEVKKYKAFNALLHNAAKQFGGYIAQEEQSQSASRIENVVTLKVPVGQFDEAVSQLTSITDSDKLIQKKISSEDVTGEVVDTKSRMEAKREVLQRYLELLKQARNMGEILKVQAEINSIQEEIEAANGRVAYLSHSAAMSTINLDYYEVLDAAAQPDPDPSFFYKLRLAFTEGGAWLGSLLLGLISIWPLLLAGLFAWLGLRKWRSSSRAKPATPSL
jgi:hypothetical protein